MTTHNVSLKRRGSAFPYMHNLEGILVVGSRFRPQDQLFPDGFLGHLDLFPESSDAEVFELFTRLQRRCKPSRFQPASRPRLRRICRITVFRGNWASCAASL